VPRYFYYVILNLYNQGRFKPFASGTLQLKHITKEDIIFTIIKGLSRQ
jgi:hypothetical protein